MTESASDARAAVTNLVHRYAELLDAGDLDGVGALFAHAELRSRPGAPVRRSADEVAAMYRNAVRLYDGIPRTKHVTTNLIIEVDVDGGTGTCRSYFTVLQEVPGQLALQPIIAGRYHDEFECVDGTWRFRSRQMFGDLYGDLGAHMQFDLPR